MIKSLEKYEAMGLISPGSHTNALHCYSYYYDWPPSVDFFFPGSDKPGQKLRLSGRWGLGDRKIVLAKEERSINIQLLDEDVGNKLRGNFRP